MSRESCMGMRMYEESELNEKRIENHDKGKVYIFYSFVSMCVCV